VGQKSPYLRKGTYTQNNMPSLRINRRRLATAYISIDSYLTIGLMILIITNPESKPEKISNRVGMSRDKRTKWMTKYSLS